MMSYRIDYSLNECIGYFGETDVLIRQAVRRTWNVGSSSAGNLGSTCSCEKWFSMMFCAWFQVNFDVQKSQGIHAANPFPFA